MGACGERGAVPGRVSGAAEASHASAAPRYPGGRLVAPGFLFLLGFALRSTGVCDDPSRAAAAVAAVRPGYVARAAVWFGVLASEGAGVRWGVPHAVQRQLLLHVEAAADHDSCPGGLHAWVRQQFRFHRSGFGGSTAIWFHTRELRAARCGDAGLPAKDLGWYPRLLRF